MELFYTPTEQIHPATNQVSIEGEEFHHLVRVLRKREGELILVTDGNGLRCEVRIASISKHDVQGEIISTTTIEPPSTRVTVALSLLKNPQRFEWFLEKATELGISTIIPMVTARTVVQPSNDRVHNKLKRWRTIVLSAARQSKRYYLPQVVEPQRFSDVLNRSGYDERCMPFEAATSSPTLHCAGKNILFLIGGEGGFSAEEVQQAEATGCRTMSLGTTILRAETAALFAVAYVRSQLLTEAPSAWL
uniref:Ribosomal RNA small subunit methyltransferase E n=1 Tax=Chlorobium chlorochromatii (strain CaD3) TaxID=340177 RepID=Q3AU46_CHLCH